MVVLDTRQPILWCVNVLNYLIENKVGVHNTNTPKQGQVGVGKENFRLYTQALYLW